MVDFIVAPILVFLLLGGWLLTQKVTRDFAVKHPELGPFKEDGAGCGGNCSGCQQQCEDSTNISR
ncbi:hypothetical protein TI04_07690 [Achromatium sp. WMS2]|nr:hypothetical protein TI04_07690 [Achromatium sp. WMS2]